MHQLAAGEAVPRVGMGIDVDEAQRLAGTKRLQDRVADGVVAASGQRQDAGFDDRPIELMDPLD